MRRILVVIVILASIPIAVWWTSFRGSTPIALGRTSVVSVTFHPVPEGPSLQLQIGSPRYPLELVQQLLPEPLPGPLRQGVGCHSGGDVEFRLSDDRVISYGPCRLPFAIHEFRLDALGAFDDFSSPHPSVPSLEAAMLAAAHAGTFQSPPPGANWTFPVDCRVDRPGRFRGADVYLCAISASGQPGVHLWEWGVLQSGELHTHDTDPQLIPTITGPFDPPWIPSPETSGNS